MICFVIAFVELKVSLASIMMNIISVGGKVCFSEIISYMGCSPTLS